MAARSPARSQRGSGRHCSDEPSSAAMIIDNDVLPIRAGRQQNVVRCAAAVSLLRGQAAIARAPAVGPMNLEQTRTQAGIDVAFADGQCRRRRVPLRRRRSPRSGSFLPQQGQGGAQRAGRRDIRIAIGTLSQWRLRLAAQTQVRQGASHCTGPRTAAHRPPTMPGLVAKPRRPRSRSSTIRSAPRLPIPGKSESTCSVSIGEACRSAEGS